MSDASDIIENSRALVSDAIASLWRTYKLADTFLNSDQQKDKLDLSTWIGRLEDMQKRINEAKGDDAVYFSGDAAKLVVDARAVSEKIVNKLKTRGLVSVVGEVAASAGKAVGETTANIVNPLLPAIAALGGLALIALIAYTILIRKV